MGHNGAANWRSEELGERREAQLPQGTVRYYERGSGPPLVFAHGLLVNANLWRSVTARLGTEFRCIAPDLPLGSHLAPLSRDADLSPPGVAELVADLMAELDLSDVILVGNDTGGALSQLVATRRPERLAGLALTSCDAFGNFPPRLFRPLVGAVARAPGALTAVLTPLRLDRPRRLPIAYGLTTKRPIERRAGDSYVLPALGDAGVRRDTSRFCAGLSPQQTLRAAEDLRRFERPALIAWSREDRLFPTSHAEALAEAIPNAQLEWIDDSYAFAPEDQPERVAALVGDFARAIQA
jgi:pimeloyl-ACP methyl ester carboxylesterase